MTSMDASADSQSSSRTHSSRRWLPLIVAAVAVAGSFVAARSLWRPSAARAQAPRTAVPPKTGPTTAPPRAAAPRAAAPPVRPPATNRNAAPAVAPASAQAVARTPANSKAGPAAPAQAIAVMAVVNGEQITREHLANECLARFGKEMLESIVNKQLIWQECQSRGISITEKDVEDEITRMAAKFGLSTDRWLAMLREERDVSPDQYRREIVWPTIALRRLASTQIEVTADELRKAFESEYGPQVKVRLIAVSAQAKATQIHTEVLANPERFGDIAKEKSEDPNSAAARGQIPPIRKHVGAPEVERVAFGLKEGEISPVVFAANQYLILKCEKQLPESYVSSSQIKQIESQLQDQIRDNKLRAAAADLFQRLQAQAKVVNVLNDAQLSQQMPGVAATINNSQITVKQLAEECLLRHGKDVLEGEINRKLLEQELRKRNKSVAQRQVDEEVFRAAEAYGFYKPDRSPDVDAWLKAVTETERVTPELYIRDSVWPSVALKTIVGEAAVVTPEDMDKGFESNYGERVEVLAIVLNNQRQASQIWEMARNNATEQFFGEMAQQYSVEPVSRSNAGKVPPIRRFGGQPLLEEEAFRLKAGELSGIIAVGDKFVILRCQGRTKPVVNDRTAVADELHKDILEKKLRIAMAQEFDRIREVAQIDNYLAGSTQSGKQAVASRPAPPVTTPPKSAAGSANAAAPRATAPATIASPRSGQKR